MTLIQELNDLNEIFFRNFFNEEDQFSRLNNVTRRDIGYPVDIIKNKDSLEFNIATVGLSKKDVDITVDGDILRIIYKAPANETIKEYLHRGITRKSFNLGFKIYPKYDLSKIKAGMDKEAAPLMTIISACDSSPGRLRPWGQETEKSRKPQGPFFRVLQG